MVLSRVVLGPLIVAVSNRLQQPQIWLGIIIAVAFLSDVFDGILARHWGTATAGLRIGDSIADTVFYLGILAVILLHHWPVLQQRVGLLAALLVLEIFRLVFDWIKFRRFASYHTYAAKLWGISLAAASITILCFNHGGWLLTSALLLGILCDLEGLAISLVQRKWTHDVKSLRTALALRRLPAEMNLK
jgi:CDP-diacylglycerol--glycerol-3-phosphate 3-phosphatidyltransferase